MIYFSRNNSTNRIFVEEIYMDMKTKSFFVTALWKPLFAAIMTAILCVSTELPEILIGVTIGVAASAGCYLDIKKYLSQKDD